MNNRILTEEEQRTNIATAKHAENVLRFIKILVQELMKRGVEHDYSKMCDPELPAFTVHTPKLASCTYGSEQYKKFLEELKPALEHHYAKNRHHPEHFPDGINGMNLIDLVEMFCDWKSSSMRHNDGNLLKSIDINAKRFGMSDQLASIFRNTAELLDGK
jgi:hypothetical protein